MKRVARFGRIALFRGFRIVWIWYADDPRRLGDPKAAGRVDWSLIRVGKDKKSCPPLKGSCRCLLANAAAIAVNRACYPIYKLGKDLSFAADHKVFLPGRMVP